MTKILIVDDDSGITLAFKKGLESDGFKVDSFHDPLEALSNFKGVSMTYYFWT